MKTVLIVDNDPIMLNTFVGLLKSQAGLIDVIAAKTSKEALDIIAGQPVHIVISGLHLPELDGLGLVTRLARAHPEIRVILMTNNASPLFRAKVKQIPTAVHFDHPPDISVLTQRIFTELQIDYGGRVQGISLSSFLQMIELEECTCTLKISAKGKNGFLFFSKGVPVAAEYGAARGKPAALQIMTWENVSIDIDYSAHDKTREINKPLMGLLMESGRIVDEKLSLKPNQRKHDRFNCLVAVDYDISDWTYQCFLRDISLGGAYIETEQSIEIGRRITLTLSAPALEGGCAITGQVVRRDEKGIGVRFDEVGLQQKKVIQALTTGRWASPPAREQAV